MANTFYKGEEQILYLVIDGVDCPIACLTSNSFSETVEMLDTTTVDNEGWKTSRPLNQSYNISFSGVQILAEENPLTRYSYHALKKLKRDRTKINWKLGVNGVFDDSGTGYITTLSESAEVGNLLTFTGTIEGYGMPLINVIPEDYYEFEDGILYQFEDGANYVFND